MWVGTLDALVEPIINSIVVRKVVVTELDPTQNTVIQHSLITMMTRSGVEQILLAIVLACDGEAKCALVRDCHGPLRAIEGVVLGIDCGAIRRLMLVQRPVTRSRSVANVPSPRHSILHFIRRESGAGTLFASSCRRWHVPKHRRRESEKRQQLERTHDPSKRMWL